MNIVKAGYEILTPISEGGIKELQHIEKIGRTCYKSEDRITEDGESAKKFISTIIKSGHESVIEHSTLSVRFVVDRGVSHEIVRHRLASYSQESQRYISYSKKPQSVSNEDDVIYAYSTGLSMKKISERSSGKYNEWDIYKILESNDIEKRPFGNKGIINETYFDDIDTAEKAYLLGFIEADGSIKRDLSQLTISQKEDEQWWLIKMFRDFIRPDSKSLYLSNNKICSALYNHGIIPNKTYENTPENIKVLWDSVPYDYKYDFLRGLMDGDGSIRWFYQLDTSKKMSCNIDFTGCKYLLEIIQNFLNEEFSYKPTIRDFNTYARMSITDGVVGKEFCERMYKHFVFPYGHSKSIRYYEAFGLDVPIKEDVIIPKGFNVIAPPYDANQSKEGISLKQLWVWGNAMLDAEIHYENMLELGASPQIARSVLPNSMKTEVNVTANYREWRNILKLRTAKAAHPQIREVMIPLLAELKEKIPVVFDDIEVE